MRRFAGFLTGWSFSVVTGVLWLVGALLPALGRPPPLSTASVLRPGASEWAELEQPGYGSNTILWTLSNGRVGFSRDGSGVLALNPSTLKWEPTTETEPRGPLPNGRQSAWHSAGTHALTTYESDPCTLFLEPGKKPLGPLPVCPDKTYEFAGAALTSDLRPIVVISPPGTIKLHAWRRDGETWTDLGELKSPAVSAQLHLSRNDQWLLWAASGDVWELHDGKSWRLLPARPSHELGRVGAIMNDGTVIAAGGLLDRQALVGSLGRLGPLVATGIAFWIAGRIRRRLGIGWNGIIAGWAVGVATCVVVLFVLLLGFGAWH